MDDPPTSPKGHALIPTASQARFLVLMAALLWSASGFFVKSPYLADWEGPQVAFWRAAFACIALWPFVRRPRWTFALIPMTILFAGMNYTYLTAMVEGSAANAIWLQCTAPVWVLLVGVFVLGERSIWRDWLMVAFAAVGIGLILYYESRGVALEAVYWGLASSFFYAGVVLSLRQLRDFDSVWLAALNHTVTVVALAPFAIGAHEWPSGIQWPLFAAFGILQMGLPVCAVRARVETNSRARGNGHRPDRAAAQPAVGVCRLGRQACLVDDRRRPVHFDWPGDSLSVAVTER